MVLCMSASVRAQETAPATNNPFTAPETPAPVETAAPAQPLTEAPAQLVKLPPGNPLPMNDYTKYFSQLLAPVTMDGQRAEMTYFLFQPEKPWAEGAKFPLVLVLHEGNGEASTAYMLISEAIRKKYPAFVLVPALPAGKRWRDSGPAKPSHSLSAAVDVLKDAMAHNSAIDTKRIYVIGCGMGGNGAYGMAYQYADLFAAAVPIAASWNPHDLGDMAKLPLAAFHGRDDKTVSYFSSADTVTAIQQNGGTAYFTDYDFLGHDCKSDRIHNDLLWQWMFAQKKP